MSSPGKLIIIWTLAGVTCQNRKWLNMSRPDFTCFLTRFLLLQELGEANTLQDNYTFMTLVFTTVFTSFQLLFLCSWDCRIWVLRKTVFRCAGKLCACYRFQSYANRQPRLRYKTDLSWDFALILTWSDVLTFAFSCFAVQRLDCDMSRQKQNARIPL